MLISGIVDVLLITCAIVGFIVLVVIYAIWLNNRYTRTSGSKVNWEEKETRKMAIKNARVISFVEPKVLPFFDCLKQALPKNYLIYPNVCLELLFPKAQRKELNLTHEYADFLVLTERYVPTVVINLLDYSLTGEVVFSISEAASDIVRNSGVPVMEYPIRDAYNVDDLRRAIAKTLNPLFGK